MRFFCVSCRMGLLVIYSKVHTQEDGCTGEAPLLSPCSGGYVARLAGPDIVPQPHVHTAKCDRAGAWGDPISEVVGGISSRCAAMCRVGTYSHCLSG